MRKRELIQTAGRDLALPNEQERRLPPIQVGRATPDVVREVEGFYSAIAEIFERWVTRRPNRRTQMTYRNHVVQFTRWVGFAWPIDEGYGTWPGLRWPDDAHEVLRVTSEDVQSYRDMLLEEGTPPNTVDQRLAALCRFYEYLIRQSAKGKLPINLMNPAHPDFVPRLNGEAKSPTRELSLEQLHELLTLPSGDSVVAHRDRAILTVGFAMGFRVSTLVRLEATDFFENQKNGPQVRYWQKGGKQESDGVHPKAFVAVRQLKEVGGISAGPLFRPRANRNSDKLAVRAISDRGMSEILQGYLDRVPGGREPRLVSGEEVMVSVFSPHSLRATTATVLDGQGVQRAKIQKLLGHKKPETTDGYCHTEHTGRDSASHLMPL